MGRSVGRFKFNSLAVHKLHADSVFSRPELWPLPSWAIAQHGLSPSNVFPFFGPRPWILNPGPEAQFPRHVHIIPRQNAKPQWLMQNAPMANAKCPNG